MLFFFFQSETFECNFGPNYHPTFEVFVNVNTEEVRLGLLDKAEGTEVWVPRRIPLTGNEKLLTLASDILLLTAI